MDTAPHPSAGPAQVRHARPVCSPARTLLWLLVCLPSGLVAGCLDEGAGSGGALPDAAAPGGDALDSAANGLPDAGPLPGGGGAGGSPAGNGGAGGAIEGAGAGGAGGMFADAGTSDGAAPDASSDAAAVVSFEPMPCWFALNPNHVDRYAVRCGFVAVPEDRTQAGTSRKVRLYVAVFSARAAAPRLLDPVVYLDGGPGGPGVIDTARMFTWFSRFVDDGREVVAIDQRGTGDSTPSLICPEKQGVAQCHEVLKARADLAQYTTLSNADDIEDVRRALGYGPWNLLGASYGTRLALEVMRRHPAGVRSVILDSVVPPDVNTLSEVAPNFARTLSEIEAACNRHPSCGHAYPNFARRVLELKQAQPYQFTAKGEQVIVTSTDMLYLLRRYAYYEQAIPDLPELAENLRDRNDQAFRTYFAPEEPEERAFSSGMHYSVRCADDVPIPIAAETTAALLKLDPAFAPFFAHEDYDGLCRFWGVPAVPAATFTPVKSAIPTLLLSGNFDPATPPHAAAHVFSSLTSASNFVVNHGSHGNFFHECAAPTVQAFLAAPSTRPTWQCPITPAEIDFNVPPGRLPPPPGTPTGGPRGPSDWDWNGLVERLDKARGKGIGPVGPGF